jgi:hypothetical protein
MLLEHRNLLIDRIPALLANSLDFQNLVRGIGQGAVLTEVPGGASYTALVTFVVDAADQRRFARALVTRLVGQFPDRVDLRAVLLSLPEEIVPTTEEPFEEVWLEGNRPFVNRRSLRNHLLNLTNAGGDRLLLLDGEPQTGKSFSFYLLSHAGSRRGFSINKFSVGQLTGVYQLADAVIGRMGVSSVLPSQGTESVHRWAEKLADVVAAAIQARATPRFFVFDDFPEVPLPPETIGFIVRLATYADQELRGLLRVVLVRFPGDLPPDLEDVALREEVLPFSSTDMVGTVMKIAKARRWDVTESAVHNKINEFEGKATRSLRDRFRFLREMLQKLADEAVARAAAGNQP